MKSTHTQATGLAVTGLTRFGYQSLKLRSYKLGMQLVQHTDRKILRPTVVVGAISTGTQQPLEAAVQHGFAAAGVDTVQCGLLPFPAITYLARAYEHQACVVMDKGWNPDWNGYVGFFSPQGTHLPGPAQQLTDQIKPHTSRLKHFPATIHGNSFSQPGASYIAFCKSRTVQPLDLCGLSIVMDAAHGSAREVAPQIFHELGARVIALGLTTCGLNEPEFSGVNRFEQLAWAVRTLHADVGISINTQGTVLTMTDANGLIYFARELNALAARHSIDYAGDDAILGALQVLSLMQNSKLSMLQVMTLDKLAV